MEIKLKSFNRSIPSCLRAFWLALFRLPFVPRTAASVVIPLLFSGCALLGPHTDLYGANGARLAHFGSDIAGLAYSAPDGTRLDATTLSNSAPARAHWNGAAKVITVGGTAFLGSGLVP